jgi:major type 1 subunit fimbrin (pilin)
VQIRIRKENNDRTIIDEPTSGQDYVIPAAGDAVSHRFTASYYAKGNSAVTAGRVHTVAGVDLVYK